MKTSKSISKINTFFISIISFFCVLLFISNAEQISDGIVSAIKTVLTVTVPALFPMFCITNMFLQTGISEKARKLFHTPLSVVFGLSGNCIQAIICGLFGGYNIALKSAVKLYDERKISLIEAQRLATFFTCPGISFCINVAGITALGNKMLGVQLLFSCISSCLLSAFIYNLFRSNKTEYIPYTDDVNLSYALVNSVTVSAKALFSVCIWIVFFATAITFLTVIIKNKTLIGLFTLFGEITASVFYCADSGKLTILPLVLSFGGICIFLQQLPELIHIKLSPVRYLVTRSLMSVLCTLLQKLITVIFPIYSTVSSNYTVLSANKYSAVGSFSLILLCAVLIFSTNKLSVPKKRLHMRRIYNNRTCQGR